MRWRDFFAARELWDSIAYDAWNGTYPQLGYLASDERPGDPAKLEALQRKEEDGTITEREAKELWYRQELHYDVMYGLFPAAVLSEALQHMVTRIIFLYIRLAPTAVSYTPDMHRVLAPLLYVAMRDPEHGLRDGILDRALHLAATGHDEVEAHAAAMFISFSSQLLRHWTPVEGSGGQDVPALLAARTQERVMQTDEELGLKLWGPMGLRSTADALLRPHLQSLFAATLPLPQLLSLWEAVLAASDRNAALVDLCVALLTAPALRHQLMLAESAERAQLLVEFPPAIPSNDLLLSAARLALRHPHPPLALAPLLPRDAAIAAAAGELRVLRLWSQHAGCALADAAERLAVTLRGDVKKGMLASGRRVTLLPYKHADGSVGFKDIAGGGYGFGECGPEASRMTRPFTRAPQVVPRLRMLGADPSAPLANLSLFLKALPPVPELGQPVLLHERVRDSLEGVAGVAGVARRGAGVDDEAEERALESGGMETGADAVDADADASVLGDGGGLFSYAQGESSVNSVRERPRLRAEYAVYDESRGGLDAGLVSGLVCSIEV
jgi:hypothetical protein